MTIYLNAYVIFPVAKTIADQVYSMIMLPSSKSRKLKFSSRQFQQISALNVLYISGNVVKNHCLSLPSALGEGKNLICAFFAGPRCHKEFHFPLFIYLYFTDGSCSWLSLHHTPPLKPLSRFLRLPRSQIRLSDLFLLVVCTRHSQPHFNLLWTYSLFPPL